MEPYQRRILEKANADHPFDVQTMVSSFVHKKLIDSQEISECLKPITISKLIDMVQENNDDAFELIVNTLKKVKYPLIEIVRKAEEEAREKAKNIEKGTHSK